MKEKEEIIGLDRKIVKLSKFCPEWITLYRNEEKILEKAIGSLVIDIQHIGSTSIPWLCAKPIIDILIGVDSMKTADKTIKIMEKIGYQFKGEAGIPGRYFFVKGKEDKRTHHLHMIVYNTERWKNYLLFRERLHRSKAVREEYCKLKIKSAEKYQYNREAYTESKSEFIQKTLKDAKNVKQSS
ncbi:MAG TPA: GrpB family protein [Candidatus Cloacimonetes bacterium]|nr:GrpB family protein [Candidatus Cloacimonadota bacterium]